MESKKEIQILHKTTKKLLMTVHSDSLRGADLQGMALRGAYLYEANLREADLREADLREVDLRGAYLWGARIKSSQKEELLDSLGIIIEE